MNYSIDFNLDSIETPIFIVDERLLQKNLEIISKVQEKSGARILLALKAFSMFSLFPLINKTLKGVCASSLHEAMLGREEFGKEVHVFAPAFSEKDIDNIIKYADHIVFNSFSQWKRFKNRIWNKNLKIESGIRINPEHSEGRVALYDPCAKGSRLGVKINDFIKNESELEGISGIHFHTLCEHNADALYRTIKAAEEKFGTFFHKMKWVNFGGGHHITRTDYDVELLCDIVINFRKKYNIDVYLEPGEAIVFNTGILASSVLDIINNDIDIAILDTSATAHMPDVLEMPYRPNILGSGMPHEKKYSYRLGGITCLAGDIIGEYSFDKPLKIGSKLIFLDMAHYTMVKTNTFNGIKLPSIAVYRAKNNVVDILKEFGYDDFKSRLS